MDQLVSLLPPDLGPLSASILIGVSLLTSALTAAMGIGGGLVLLAVMANVMPAPAIVPVHGVVQLGSNTGRALLMTRHIDIALLLPFAAGSVIGAAVGGALAVDLPRDALRLILGGFILYTVWVPPPRLGRGGAATDAVGGAISTGLSMFVGATGPFIAALWIARQLPRQVYVATHAACMTVQHLLKIGAFAALGFAFAPWWPLIGAMIASGFVGTVLGGRLLHRLPERAFRRGLKILLTLLALNLLAQAGFALL